MLSAGNQAGIYLEPESPFVAGRQKIGFYNFKRTNTCYW
jgi:hypothetical protein